jgi:hypothetical protein
MRTKKVPRRNLLRNEHAVEDLSFLFRVHKLREARSTDLHLIAQFLIANHSPCPGTMQMHGVGSGEFVAHARDLAHGAKSFSLININSAITSLARKYSYEHPRIFISLSGLFRRAMHRLRCVIAANSPAYCDRRPAPASRSLIARNKKIIKKQNEVIIRNAALP